jgi:hypothetical protein
MIKARGTNRNGRDFVLFGLSHANLDRLKNDEPIVFDGAPYGIPMEVVIVAGETEQELAKRFSMPETKIKIEKDAP